MRGGSLGLGSSGWVGILCQRRKSPNVAGPQVDCHLARYLAAAIRGAQHRHSRLEVNGLRVAGLGLRHRGSDIR